MTDQSIPAIPNLVVNEETIDLEALPNVIEGQAKIVFNTANEVFYNPVQQFNRDMSIAAIRTWIGLRDEEIKAKIEKKKGKEAADEFVPKKPTVLEALAATGLRTIRYAKEIDNIGQILVNDLEPQAVEAIKRNLKANGLDEDRVKPNLGDAIDVMYAHRQPELRFDCIDLDPYGSASPFIDGAVQAVADGGLLCVTCTDLAVLASMQHTEACFTKYGGVPIKAGFCHEAALRLVIHSIMTSAARYKRTVTPLVSCSIDFYVRIFFRVNTSPAQVKFNASKTSIVYKCSGCGSFDHAPIGKMTPTDKGPKFGPSQPPPAPSKCQFCGFKLHIGGPMYNGPLHDKTFVGRMLGLVKSESEKFHTIKRMEGMLTVISEELDSMLFYSPSELSQVVRTSTPKLPTLRSAILNMGYKVAMSHCVAGSIKTDAPASVLWDIMRSWADKNPPTLANFPQGAPGLAILKREINPAVSFDLHAQAKPDSASIKLVRYQINPEKNWGPKPRHKRKAEDSIPTNQLE